MEIKLLITDFDGTLVNTFQANFCAYREAFEQCGMVLTEEQYHGCYGMRFDKFMETMGIADEDICRHIRSYKGNCYPKYFDMLELNRPLLDFIRMFRQDGGMTAVASTARGKNLTNALNYLDIADEFDLVLAGEDVVKGKPSPEIYNTVMSRMGVSPDETLIFEDSAVGLQAAQACGAHYIKIQL